MNWENEYEKARKGWEQAEQEIAALKAEVKELDEQKENARHDWGLADAQCRRYRTALQTIVTRPIPKACDSLDKLLSILDAHIAVATDALKGKE